MTATMFGWRLDGENGPPSESLYRMAQRSLATWSSDGRLHSEAEINALQRLIEAYEEANPITTAEQVKAGLIGTDRIDVTMLPDLSGDELELRSWWLAKAHDEIGKTVPKAIEYGSTDLIDIGLMLGRTMGRPVSEEEAAEMGVFFYLIGKIARWQSAIQRGERPSDDTLLDIGVYVRMAQRIRHSGGWPGIKGEPK